MTSIPPLSEHRPPSWVVPILVGATATFAVTGGLTVLLPAIAPTAPEVAGCVQCCGCGIAVPVFGVIPAIVARRRDPSLTVGQAFAVAFIAVGLGSVLWAAMVFLSSSGDFVTPDEVREVLEKGFEQTPEPDRPSDEELDRWAEIGAELAQYMPAITALVMTLIGGLAGMVTCAIARSRSGAPRA